jgi:NAD(P)-dependent dehydrogenase (short-subunit alcohol dehydrogenase family)
VSGGGRVGRRRQCRCGPAGSGPWRRVNAITPGTIDTELSAGAIDPQIRRERLEKRARERIPLRRTGQPEDLAGAAAFLCSDDTAYVTGHVLVVDGGILTL